MAVNSYFQTFTISYVSTFIISCVMHEYVFSIKFNLHAFALTCNDMTLLLITGSTLHTFVANSCNVMAIKCPRLTHVLSLQQSMILEPVRVTFIAMTHISSFSWRFQIYLFYFGNACEFISVFHIGGGNIFPRAVGVC